MSQEMKRSLGVVHACNPSHWEDEAGEWTQVCRPHSKKRETQREKEYRGTQRETQRGIERERRQRQRDRARRDREKTEERERENINVYPSLCPPPSISWRQGLTYPRMDSEAL